MEFQNDARKDCLSDIKAVHSLIKGQIDERLEEFKDIWDSGTAEDVLVELLFCILTPQSNAHRCWDIMTELRTRGVVFTIGREELAKALEKGARFKNNKARYFIEARELFSKDLDIREHLSGFKDPCLARAWLVENIKGIGFKEASHFLRNIGWGGDLAILDRHILKNLVELGALEGMSKSIGPKRYCEIESRMREFSQRIGIPMDHLDLLLWYREKGEIFK